VGKRERLSRADGLKPADLAKAYAVVFGDVAGEQVLDDLRKRFHIFSTTMAPDGSLGMAHREGQRSVVLLIENLIAQHEQQ